MGIYAQYERDDWEAQGGWRGVGPAVTALTLLFRDDADEGDLERNPETRTETPVASEPGLLCVTVRRHRFYRDYERQDDGTWLLGDEGQRVFEERVYLGRSAPQPTRVVHMTKYAPGDKADVYVGRAVGYYHLRRSLFANSFKIGKDGTRTQVITKFLHRLVQQPHLLDRLPELRGKKLGCWCAGPEGLPPTLEPRQAACHGQILAALADSPLGDAHATPQAKAHFLSKLRRHLAIPASCDLNT